MPEKTIALGVTGSIAAYKAADLCSQLVKNELDVVVLMTESAQKLVGKQTFLTLSGNPVVTSLWEVENWRPGHIELAERADIFVVAPCTANFIGKFASGIADDALTTYALSHTGPILLAPAMNPRMWNNPAVQANCKTLISRGVEFIGPDTGRVACGDPGTGRMQDVPSILTKIREMLY